MRTRDIVIGIIVLLLLVAGIIWLRNRNQTRPIDIPEPTPQPDIERTIEERFGVDIPEDAEKAELRDVAGMDASGIVTKNKENSTVEVNILADLPDPKAGSYYQAFAEVNGEERSLGRLTVAKGGFSLGTKINVGQADVDKVFVVLRTPGEDDSRVLEAGF